MGIVGVALIILVIVGLGYVFRRYRQTMTAAAAPQAWPAAPPDTTPPAPLVTRRLTKKYGELTAVNRLDLEVRRGEIFGLLGQNAPARRPRSSCCSD